MATLEVAAICKGCMWHAAAEPRTVDLFQSIYDDVVRAMLEVTFPAREHTDAEPTHEVEIGAKVLANWKMSREAPGVHVTGPA